MIALKDLPPLAIGAVGGMLVLIILLSRTKPDPREPPYVKEKIPYFSHIYGLLRHGLRYFDLVRLAIITRVSM